MMKILRIFGTGVRAPSPGSVREKINSDIEKRFQLKKGQKRMSKKITYQSHGQAMRVLSERTVIGTNGKNIIFFSRRINRYFSGLYQRPVGVFWDFI